ncbi:MAG TPA: hypothetical protein VFO44_02300 [Steroidobacteraceae bacterium]|nr:hypothetical protein [Steroidobacteraceae bacterium]
MSWASRNCQSEKSARALEAAVDLGPRPAALRCQNASPPLLDFVRGPDLGQQAIDESQGLVQEHHTLGGIGQRLHVQAPWVSERYV